MVKYALDTFASDNGASLSCTHDANAWPADRYAGLPAPREDEQVILWLQNSHAAPIPPRAVSLDRMGAERPVPLAREVGPFATVALDVASLLPGVHPVPPEIDRQVAALKLHAEGIAVDTLTEQQEQYLRSWEEGT